MRCKIFLTFLLIVSIPAFAETRIAMREIIPHDAASGLAAKQIQDGVDGELAILIEKAQDDGSCDITMVDISKKVRDARDTEKMLQDKGYSPKGSLVIEEIRVSAFIDGVVGIGDGDVTWIMRVSDATSGKVVAKDEGFAPEGNMMDAVPRIAKKLFDQLCKKKTWRVKARYNDLVINDMVCDLTQPFVLHGSGASAGIALSMTPTRDDGGSFGVSGTAGGVPWSGGGTYTHSIDGKIGKMAIAGTWTITSPVGKFSDSGTIKATLSEDEGCK